MRLLEPKLADITGDRGLGHRAAGRGEGLRQLELRSDPLSRDDAGQQPLALRFGQRLPVRLHSASICNERFRHSGDGKRYTVLIDRRGHVNRP